jgi:hypothetical protein
MPRIRPIVDLRSRQQGAAEEGSLDLTLQSTVAGGRSVWPALQIRVSNPPRRDFALRIVWGRERSALRDPLNRPRRYAELRGDLMKSWPPRSRQSVTDSLFRIGCHSGAPEGLAALGAARLGPGDASSHPLYDHRQPTSYQLD